MIILPLASCFSEVLSPFESGFLEQVVRLGISVCDPPSPEFARVAATVACNCDAALPPAGVAIGVVHDKTITHPRTSRAVIESLG